MNSFAFSSLSTRCGVTVAHFMSVYLQRINFLISLVPFTIE